MWVNSHQINYPFLSPCDIRGKFELSAINKMHLATREIHFLDPLEGNKELDRLFTTHRSGELKAPNSSTLEFSVFNLPV